MVKAKRFTANWLINDVCRAKALIKYEIKQVESRLQQAMGDGKNTRLKSQEAARYCSELVMRYGNLLKLLEQSAAENSVETDPVKSSPENNPSRCYIKIQTLKQQLTLTIKLADEIKLVNELKNYYDFLQSQLNGLQPQSLEFIHASLTGKLKNIVQSNSSFDWLLAIVAFANDAGENPTTSLALLAQLSDKELRRLLDLFAQDEFVLLINSIFFYKLNPDQLFKQPLHPEKFVSVKARLSMLHHFIEMIHQTVMQTLWQRGIYEIHDYLFHGDELPQGITIDSENSIRDLITAAIKEWHVHAFINTDDLVNKNKLYDLFRAYKFWFNPNRLIDTAMILQQGLTDCIRDTDEFYKNFSQQMLVLYHQLTTTECLDLYGYFANKDSCYLMRTLSAVMQGQALPPLPVINQSQREAVGRVHRVLDCVMESIREELVERHITTAPYTRNYNSKQIRPGRRNLSAISRIIDLYCNPTAVENQTIEQLFNEVGGNL